MAELVYHVPFSAVTNDKQPSRFPYHIRKRWNIIEGYCYSIGKQAVSKTNALPKMVTSLGIDAATGEDIKVEDKKRNQGIYVTGSQGTGQSTLIETILYQNFVINHSEIVIDPYGQLIKHLISIMLEHRLQEKRIQKAMRLTPYARVQEEYREKARRGVTCRF